MLFPFLRGLGLVLVCVLLSQREFLTNMTLEYKPKKKQQNNEMSKKLPNEPVCRGKVNGEFTSFGDYDTSVFLYM